MYNYNKYLYRTEFYSAVCFMSISFSVRIYILACMQLPVDIIIVQTCCVLYLSTYCSHCHFVCLVILSSCLVGMVIIIHATLFCNKHNCVCLTPCMSQCGLVFVTTTKPVLYSILYRIYALEYDQLFTSIIMALIIMCALAWRNKYTIYQAVSIYNSNYNHCQNTILPFIDLLALYPVH